MSIISYAQNFEDVMLWRALKHIEHGFYIDVGAAWPTEHSVTKAFYDNGWNGINIEPNPAFISQYKKNRVKDINLQVAVSNVAGKAQLFFIENTGLSSMDQAIAQSHQSSGFEFIPAEVEVSTLKHIFSSYAKSKEIHFLKVDVEGSEEKVLAGNDWTKFRPWIVLVEATLPLSQVENYEQWEPTLLIADYQFVYADGLNRFYIAKEHAELAESFRYPPNVFDDFVLASDVCNEAKLSEAEAKASEAEAKASEAHAKASEADAKVIELAIHLDAILNSRSWRITSPMRWCGFQLNLLRARGFKQRFQDGILRALSIASWYLEKHPNLKRVVLRTLQYLGITRIISDMRISQRSSNPYVFNDEEVQVLSKRARYILSRLKDTGI
ncbi:MAG: FkbM family methyltransferase [Oceanospirillaceae bacterium]|nr:FkbM family methyltransferase [Oceanospirillaceae bacterium]